MANPEDNRPASEDAASLNSAQGTSHIAMRISTESKNPKRNMPNAIRHRKRRKRRSGNRRAVTVARGQTMFDFDSVLVPE